MGLEGFVDWVDLVASELVEEIEDDLLRVGLVKPYFV